MFSGRFGVAAMLVLTATLSLAAASVDAGQHKRQSNGASSSAAMISPDRAAAVARGATGGRVLKVDRKGNVYRVRLLLDGQRVRNVKVDARTGRLLN